MRGAINRGEFDPKGQAAKTHFADRTFADLLDTFEQDYVAKRKADGKLRSNSHTYYVARLRAEFAAEKVIALEQNHRRFESWLDALTFTTGPAGKQITRKLAPPVGIGITSTAVASSLGPSRRAMRRLIRSVRQPTVPSSCMR